MEDRKFIPLFREDTLKNLNKKLKDMSSSKARVLEKDKIKKEAHCNVLTSMARLLSTREVCGCFHLKEGELFLFTNKNTKSGAFRKEIGGLICQLIKEDFQEEDKLALYRKCFKEAIKAKVKPYTNTLLKDKFFEYEIIRRDNWDKMSFDEIVTLKERTKALLPPECLQILIHLDDIDRICDKEEYNEIYLLIDKKPLTELFKEASLTERYSSDDDIHCELAAIESGNVDSSLEELVGKLSKRVERKEFTISKFCCYLCGLIFESLKRCCDEEGNLNFDRLGNSCTLFPNYKSPSIEESIFSSKIVDDINSKIGKVVEEVEAGECKLEDRTVIENSKLIKHEFVPPERSVNTPTM